MTGCLIALIAIAFVIGISWAVTCGLIFLITLCFGIEFSWAIATGIWLILVMVSSFFRSGSRSSSSKK